ncbi:MAG: dicarboxylate transporter, DctM subunit [Rhodopila sp.]|nr:dicarboxylate transporter, DctM subunit [Rhodopila sp.]
MNWRLISLTWPTAEPMWTVLFLVMFFGLLAAGMPIFLVLGACAAVLYAVSGQPMIGVAQVIIDHLNSSTLMSLPLFVMAAAFMRQGGVAKALVDVSAAWLGGIRGSLGLVTVVACTLFAAICGSSVATALAMGTILLPAMIEKGYPRSFALGVIGASGTIGIVIPPSLALILYGIVAEQSVPRLFLAGILPGLLQAAAFFAWVWYDARRRNFPREPSLPYGDRLRVTVRALPALAVPVIVLVGIYGGIVTVTEAAALAAVVALLVSLVFYRGFRFTQTLSVIADALRSAGTIMLIVASALAFGHWMTESGAPAQLVSWVLAHNLPTWLFLLSINVLLLVLGCFLEVVAALLLVIPILAPALIPLGVDPVHFSIIFTHNMEIALIHPPVGLNLYVLSTISDAPIGEVIRGILPFLILLLIVLGIITYVPALTMWLPGVVYGN